jgi:hypothetical protein
MRIAAVPISSSPWSVHASGLLVSYGVPQDGTFGDGKACSETLTIKNFVLVGTDLRGLHQEQRIPNRQQIDQSDRKARKLIGEVKSTVDRDQNLHVLYKVALVARPWKCHAGDQLALQSLLLSLVRWRKGTAPMHLQI